MLAESLTPDDARTVDGSCKSMPRDSAAPLGTVEVRMSD